MRHDSPLPFFCYNARWRAGLLLFNAGAFHPACRFLWAAEPAKLSRALLKLFLR